MTCLLHYFNHKQPFFHIGEIMSHLRRVFRKVVAEFNVICKEEIPHDGKIVASHVQ